MGAWGGGGGFIGTLGAGKVLLKARVRRFGVKSGRNRFGAYGVLSAVIFAAPDR